MGWCFACYFCRGARDKRYQIVPSHKTSISVRTSVTRCLISTCKIPANLPYHLQRVVMKWTHPCADRLETFKFLGALRTQLHWFQDAKTLWTI
jgi:hypothetical protein